MAYSTIPKVRRDGTITLKDAGAVTLAVSYEEGNFSVDIPPLFFGKSINKGGGYL